MLTSPVVVSLPSSHSTSRQYSVQFISPSFLANSFLGFCDTTPSYFTGCFSSNLFFQLLLLCLLFECWQVSEDGQEPSVLPTPICIQGLGDLIDFHGLSTLYPVIPHWYFQSSLQLESWNFISEFTSALRCEGVDRLWGLIEDERNEETKS